MEESVNANTSGVKSWLIGKMELELLTLFSGCEEEWGWEVPLVIQKRQCGPEKMTTTGLGKNSLPNDYLMIIFNSSWHGWNQWAVRGKEQKCTSINGNGHGSPGIGEDMGLSLDLYISEWQKNQGNATNLTFE